MSKNQVCPARLAEEERKITERCEARYAKFVYDITQEIVQNGYYKDEEMKEVFRRHLNENARCLDRVRI